MGGQIVDATIVAAPKQRNTREEKQAIKQGRVPDDWADKPAKLAQKDRDARWTVKFTKAKPYEDGSKPPVDIAIPGFGYKNHIGIDRRHGLIRTWVATSAAAHDGARGEERASPRRLRLRVAHPRKDAQGQTDADPHPHRQRSQV